MSTSAKKTARPVKIDDLARRLEAVEKRPDIFRLDSSEDYILVVPSATTDEEWKALSNAVRKYQNVTLVAADNAKVVCLN